MSNISQLDSGMHIGGEMILLSTISRGDCPNPNSNGVSELISKTYQLSIKIARGLNRLNLNIECYQASSEQ